MPTLSTRISNGEHKAITEYANACGLSVSELIKKVLIHKICWLWEYNENEKYFEDMYSVEPEKELDTDEELCEFVNKFRKFIGISPMKIK